MARRRPPSMRRTNSTSASSSSSSSSSPRRNADTRNLVTATNVFGGQEVGGFLRTILLGAFVGGLVIFLFYPDISGLLEHWHNSSEASGLLGTSFTEKDSRSEGAELRSMNSNKEEQNGPPQPANTKRSEKTKEAPKPKPNPKPKPEEKKMKKEEEYREEFSSSCPCTCQRQPVSPPPKCQPPPAKKPKVAKTEKPPKEDLMEEEEIVEEDPVEVELMEEEEPVDFIELDPEEDTAAASSPVSDEHLGVETIVNEEPPVVKEGQTNPHNDDEELQFSKDSHIDTRDDKNPVPAEDTPSSTPEEEPLVLTNGQPITFTPVNSGDENFIRVGGRPKSNKEPSSQTQAHTSPTKQNSSAKSSTSKTTQSLSGKAQKNEADSGKRSQAKPESGSQKKKTSGGKSGKEEGDASDDDDLPDEVRNFQPSYLKTVTAKKIFADGRRIPPVELLPQKETNSSVRVFLFNEFLSEAECDGLRRVHDKHVHDMASRPLLCFDSLSTLRKHLRDVKSDVRVTPNDFVAGTKCLNSTFSQQLGEWMRGNWSYSTAFYPGESRFSTQFAARVQYAMGLQPSNGGKFQITSYPTGKAYKAHTDCVLDGSDPRDRVATVLVYLDDVEDGGETKFPELGIWVKPRKGRALVWNNMSPGGQCEPHSLHVASKVNSGSKYILIRWYYYKNFYSLGKRPPEPPLPARAPGTPRVSCDDYDNGSCRWYDEWNNDHLLDYEFNKYTFI